MNRIRRILSIVVDAVNFVSGLFGSIALTLWTWLVMLFLLIFKGRDEMGLYHKRFMASEPDFNNILKWNFIGAVIFGILSAFLWHMVK